VAREEMNRHNINTTPRYNTEPGYNGHSEPPLGHRMPSINDFALRLSQIRPAAVIAFTAPKGTGKDTTARRLYAMRYFNYDGVEVTQDDRYNKITMGPFHNAFDHSGKNLGLYRMVAELIGWTTDQIDGPAKEITWTVEPTPENVQWAKEHPGAFTDRHIAPTASLVEWSPRKLLEQLGSNFVRDKIGRDHWVQLLKARLDKHTSGITIITDCRFVNEAQIADLVVELRREGKEYDERPDSEGGHESRRRLPAHLIDYTCHLTPDMDYHIFAEDLLEKVQRKRAKKAAQAAADKELGEPIQYITEGHKGSVEFDAGCLYRGPDGQIHEIPPGRLTNAPEGHPDGPHAGIERGDA
jgi:hypothetical protein